MSDAERKANAFKEPLATKGPAKTYGAPAASHTPPPMRGAQAQPAGLGSATALYDYEGTDPSDLPCLEGEVLTVVEHGEHRHAPSRTCTEQQTHRSPLLQCRRIGGSAGIAPGQRGSFL